MFSILFLLCVGEIWAHINTFSVKTVCFFQTWSKHPKHTLKPPSHIFFFCQKMRLLKIIIFWEGIRIWRYGIFAFLKHVKTPKTVKNGQFFLKKSKTTQKKLTLEYNYCLQKKIEVFDAKKIKNIIFENLF